MSRAGHTKRWGMNMEIDSQLPKEDIDQILDLIRQETDAPIIYLKDEELGPEVRTGRLHGYIWVVRRGRTKWRILQKLQWCT